MKGAGSATSLPTQGAPSANQVIAVFAPRLARYQPGCLALDAHQMGRHSRKDASQKSGQHVQPEAFQLHKLPTSFRRERLGEVYNREAKAFWIKKSPPPAGRGREALADGLHQWFWCRFKLIY